MKRSGPLKRYTPLKRSGRLRPVSKETAKLKRETNPERAAFLADVETCMFEGCSKPCCDPHEIARSHAREDCLTEWDLVMGLCRKHHEIVQDWPIEKQIAARFRWQIERACRRYNELRGTAPTHVTTEGVIGYLMFRKRKQFIG